MKWFGLGDGGGDCWGYELEVLLGLFGVRNCVREGCFCYGSEGWIIESSFMLDEKFWNWLVVLVVLVKVLYYV